jgi:hypothetical protein
MKNTDLIRRKLAQRLAAASGTTQYGAVKSVDEAKRTCVVQIGGIEYTDILLYAVEDANLMGYVYIPATGSTVLG